MIKLDTIQIVLTCDNVTEQTIIICRNKKKTQKNLQLGLL